MNRRTVFFALLTTACATSHGAVVGDSLESPVLNVSSLDVNGDGTVDTKDHAVLDGLSKAAIAKLGSEPEPILIPLYKGMGTHTHASLLKLAKQDKGEWDLDAYDAVNLRRLAAEAKWLASQVKIVGSFKEAPDKQAQLAGILTSHFPGYSADSMSPKAICDAIQLLDTKAIRAKGLALTAVFDLDETLWDGHGIDYFLSALVESEKLTKEAQPAMVEALLKIEGVDEKAVKENSVQANGALVLKHATDASLPKAERLNRKDGFYLVAAMLKGMSKQDAYKIAQRSMTQGSSAYPPLQGKFYDDPSGCSMRRVVAQLRSAGFQVFFISAGLDVLVEVAGDMLGIGPAQRIGSILEVNGEIYTGKVDSTYMLKGTVVREWLGGPAYLAFGDSVNSDFPFMLDAAGPAFMINPDDRFKKKDQDKAGGRFVEVRYEKVEGGNP
jgi:phosphoserine phosphatase